MSRVISLDMIVRVVADDFDVSKIAIMSPRRDADAVLARHVCMWIARRVTALSFPQIGRYFSDRDHSSVMHACQSIDRKMPADGALAQRVMDLMDALSEGMAAP